jgi:hypothetical protein
LVVLGVLVLGFVAAVGCETFYPLDGYKGSDAARTEGGTPNADGACDRGFCGCLVSAPAFCDDFDEGPLGARWDGEASPPSVGATAKLDPNTSASGPNSLGITMPPGGGDTYLAYAIPRVFHEARVEFDMLAPEGFTDDQVLAFRFDDSGYFLALVLTGTASSYDSRTGAPTTFGVSPRVGAWTHVTVILRMSDAASGTKGLFRLSFGNPDAGDPFYDHEIDTGPPEKSTLRFGCINAMNSPNGWRANFDNLVLFID